MTDIQYEHIYDADNELSAKEILSYVFTLKKINSVIDIGCGAGSWLNVAQGYRKEILGVDGIRVDDKLFKLKDHNFLLHDLRVPLQLNKKFDLALCLEVVEHLESNYADNIVETITNHSDLVLFSAAIPNQTGDHHVNEQWPNYWKDKFQKRNYKAYDILRPIFWENKKIEWWYRQNIILFSRENNNNLGEEKEYLMPLVHPDFFLAKLNEANFYKEIAEKHVFNPRLLSSLKKVYLSIFDKSKK